jgi:hypothetical protein
MKKNYLILAVFAIVVFLTACKSNPTTSSDMKSFGAGVSHPENPAAFADVVRQLETQDSVNTILRAKVSEVCQAKGCWMNLVDNNGVVQDELFVKFHDYGFFVPKDIAGREVIVEGVAYKEETSVEELKHYAEDAGKSEEEIAAITEPISEMKFMATGVILLDQ